MANREPQPPKGRSRLWNLDNVPLPADLDGIEAPYDFSPSATARFRWGRHFEERLIAHAAEYMASEPFRLHQHHDDERREFWITIEFIEAPPLLEWALMLGDVLHSYRVALDHVMWEIAVRHNHPDPPPKPRAVSYPIYRDDKKFNDWLKSLKFDLPEEFVEILRAHQPYGSHGSGFAELADLNNTDKHQVLPVIALAEQTSRMGGRSEPDGARSQYLRLEPDQPLRTGSEMVRMRFDQPMKHVELDYRPQLAPALPRTGDKAHLRPWLLSDMLTGLGQLAHRGVLELPHQYLGSPGARFGDTGEALAHRVPPPPR